MMSDLPKLKWKRVKTADEIGSIAEWVKARHVNTYIGPKPDKNGHLIILLGWDDKPESDWGKFRGHSAAIWFAEPELARLGEVEVRNGLGWDPAGEF